MLHQLSLTGLPRRRGQERGEAFRALIHEQIERNIYLSLLVEPSIDPVAFVDQFVRETGHLNAAEKRTPHLVEEVKGISEGSGISFNGIFALSCPDEMIRYAEWLAGKQAFACSSLGCFREENTPALMGQNLDTAEIAQGLITLLHIHSDTAPEVLIVAQPGSLGSIGLNRSPLGVCVNTINLKSNRNGLPLQFISRALLEKFYLNDAVEFLQEIVPGAAQNFMIGDAEQVLDFECSGSKVVQFIPKEGARRVWHTNHHLANNDIIPEYYPIAPDSLERYGYFEFRLNEPQKPITLENIQGILRTHLAPICYHGWGKPETTRTWVSVIYELTTPPVLYLAVGNPCENCYQRFGFEG
jgi:hypothetical protein